MSSAFVFSYVQSLIGKLKSWVNELGNLGESHESWLKSPSRRRKLFINIDPRVRKVLTYLQCSCFLFFWMFYSRHTSFVS